MLALPTLCPAPMASVQPLHVRPQTLPWSQCWPHQDPPWPCWVTCRGSSVGARSKGRPPRQVPDRSPRERHRAERQGALEDTQPHCTVLQKLWLLPSERAPPWLQTLTGLGGLPTADPFSFGHTRAINFPIRRLENGWVSGWEGHAEGCSGHPALPSTESGSKACPALQQPPQVERGIRGLGPHSCSSPSPSPAA